MIVRFRCPSCACPGRLDLDTAPPALWQCPACDQRQELHIPAAQQPLQRCVLCGNEDLYKKKNFPHWLGLAILTGACLGFLGLMAVYEWEWAWVVLVGSAAFDGLLYLWVGDAVVCYRCLAHHHGVPQPMDHKPFELTVHERYRQERLRREQLNK